jgi:hypothetical protein
MPYKMRELRVRALARIREILRFFCTLDGRDARDAAAKEAQARRMAMTPSDPKWRVFFAEGVEEDEAHRVDWSGLERLSLKDNKFNHVNGKLEGLLVMTSDGSQCVVRGGSWQHAKVDKCTSAYSQLWKAESGGVFSWLKEKDLEYYCVRDKKGHREESYGVTQFRATCVLDKASSTLVVLMVWKSDHSEEDLRYLPCKGDKDQTLRAVDAAREARRTGGIA